MNLRYRTEHDPVFDVPEVLVSHVPLQVLLAPLKLLLMFLTDRRHRLSPLFHLTGEDEPEGGIKLVVRTLALLCGVEVREGELPHPPRLDGGRQAGVVGRQPGQVEVQVDEDQGD